jgi:cysteinyl-tRNA synthetase
MDGILGIWPNSAPQADTQVVEGLMQLILELRAGARAEKNWPVADQIRQALQTLDITVEDTPTGPHYKLPNR